MSGAQSDPYSVLHHPPPFDYIPVLRRNEATGFDCSRPRGLAAAAERVTGHEPAAIGVPYRADMGLLVNEGSTPCVMYGPGDVRHAHADYEHVPFEEVVTCAEVLAEWVTQ